MLSLPRIIAALSILIFISICSSTTLAQEHEFKTSVSPLRLSYIEGRVSFWRPGAPDWVEAQQNTPLAVGDALYVGKDSDLELQMGNRAFIRADDDTQLSLINQTTDFIQFRVISGRVSFDLRALSTGYSVEVDTPNTVFTIDHAGYYRVDVNADVHFITRRGGLAIMIPTGGRAMSIHPSEEIVVRGTTVAQAETYAVPELDQWDRWNYDRTDGLIDTISERYLPYGVAGVSDLDHYGNWRVVPDYGPVWVPDAVSSDWVPYSMGRWGWDPYYQWTWIDDAPWGWAPFHYGRWIYMSGYWAWAPGLVTRHPVYAPALVAFFNVNPTASVGISSSGIGWVALGWGEPVSPWWGQRGFVGKTWWGGWRGLRVVNNVYHNIRVDNSIVATTYEHFGKGHVHDAPVHVTRHQELEYVYGDLQVKPVPASLVGGAAVSIRPPEDKFSRSVVGTRPPRKPNLPWRDKTSKPEMKTDPEQLYVSVPKRHSNEMLRPEFGTQTGEERLRPPLPPRFDERRRPAIPDSAGRERAEIDQTAPKVSRTPSLEVQPQRIMRETTPQERVRLAPEPRRVEVRPADPHAAPIETKQQEHSELPGKPANRIYNNKNKKKGDQRHSD